MEDRRRGPVVPLVAAAAVCVAVAVGLVRWSLWWPHPDLRQVWATAATALAVVTGAAAAVVASRRLGPAHRATIVGLLLAAALVGAFAVYPLLRGATLPLL